MNVDSYEFVMDRLKCLAVFAEKKYAMDHPNVKDGDYIDVRDYLTTLFDIMYVSGLRVPPVTIGKKLYSIISFDDSLPFVCEFQVKGLALIEDVWYFINEYHELLEFCAEDYFLTLEGAERALAERKKETNA